MLIRDIGIVQTYLIRMRKVSYTVYPIIELPITIQTVAPNVDRGSMISIDGFKQE